MQANIQAYFTRIRENISTKLIVKYFLIIMAIVVVCCSTLGLLLFTFIADRWQNEQQKILAENAQNIALLAGRTSTLTLKYDPDGKVTNSYSFTDRVTDVLVVSGESIEADIFIVDLDGNTVLCSEDLYGISTCRHRAKPFAPSLIQNVLTGKTDFRMTSTLDGVYADKHYIVGVPIVAADAEGHNAQIGIVFMRANRQNDKIIQKRYRKSLNCSDRHRLAVLRRGCLSDCLQMDYRADKQHFRGRQSLRTRRFFSPSSRQVKRRDRQAVRDLQQHGDGSFRE